MTSKLRNVIGSQASRTSNANVKNPKIFYWFEAGMKMKNKVNCEPNRKLVGEE